MFITKALAPAVSSGGETQKRNDGKFPPPKAKAGSATKWRPTRGYRVGRWGRRWPRGESSAWSGHFDLRGGGHCLAPSPSRNALCFHLGIASSGTLRRIPSAPLTLPLNAPFAARDGAVVTPKQSIYLAWWRSWRSRVAVLPAVKVGQGKGDETGADFLMLIASDVSTAGPTPLVLGLSRKPDTSGGTPSSLV